MRFDVSIADISRFCNFKVHEFRTDASARRKSSVHDLGEFVIYLLCCDDGVSWKDVAIALLLELFDRNVLWILKKYPELENTGQSPYTLCTPSARPLPLCLSARPLHALCMCCGCA